MLYVLSILCLQILRSSIFHAYYANVYVNKFKFISVSISSISLVLMTETLRMPTGGYSHIKHSW